MLLHCCMFSCHAIAQCCVRELPGLAPYSSWHAMSCQASVLLHTGCSSPEIHSCTAYLAVLHWPSHMCQPLRAHTRVRKRACNRARHFLHYHSMVRCCCCALPE